MHAHVLMGKVAGQLMRMTNVNDNKTWHHIYVNRQDFLN